MGRGRQESSLDRRKLGMSGDARQESVSSFRQSKILRPMTPEAERTRRILEETREADQKAAHRLRVRQQRARTGGDLGDVSLSAHQMTELKEVFDAFATSFDGPEPEACAADFAHMWRALKGNPTNKDVQRRFAECDGDHNGKLGFQEFIEFVSPMMDDSARGFEQMIEQNIEEALGALDADSDGKIHVEELRMLLKSEGEILDEEELNDVMALMKQQGVECMHKKQLAAFILQC